MRCRSCREGTLEPCEEPQRFHPPTGEMTVACLRSRCATCGATTTLASQHTENLRRLAGRRAAYSPYLLGEDILALRRRYGLTQQAASRIFGKGKIAFSRYESETSFPDLSTTKLLRLAMRHPRLLKELADEAHEPVPLWEDRLAELEAQQAPTAAIGG